MENKYFREMSDMIEELIGCPDLNLEELEEDTLKTIDKALKLLNKIKED